MVPAVFILYGNVRWYVDFYPYEMTAVAKAGFLADVGKVKISETKKIFCFLDSYHFDKMPAGLSVVFFKFCGKVRITHVKIPC